MVDATSENPIGLCTAEALLRLNMRFAGTATWAEHIAEDPGALDVALEDVLFKLFKQIFPTSYGSIIMHPEIFDTVLEALGGGNEQSRLAQMYYWLAYAVSAASPKSLSDWISSDLSLEVSVGNIAASRRALDIVVDGAKRRLEGVVGLEENIKLTAIAWLDGRVGLLERVISGVAKLS